MTPREVAALIAYVVKLDPRLALDDQAAAGERLAQWCDLLSDVPATAHGWDAARTARDYIARNPYRIQPSDVSRPWHTHKADVMSRHVGTFEPTAHPEIDPDDRFGNAYVAALRAERVAIASGQQAPTTHRAITAGPAAAEVTRRLRELGEYMPPTVAQALAQFRPHRTERERLARDNAPDPLTVACTWCDAAEGEPCRGKSVNPRNQQTRYRPLSKAHPCRVEDATAAHLARNNHQEAHA
ncbi:cell surface glycoprotein [Streptomyces sp. MBT53]|uniref:zinc finger domain-containing protein n=1 Tax=Streptomyces sp. MBT53 TaxID=1488384 RepID=UPI001912DDCF|nr:cell surface glycoprotein [Streptomyces sp. MBT53]MBK6018533.1 cell surface glycoprotein [Streptomyces sp. MBT53]